MHIPFPYKTKKLRSALLEDWRKDGQTTEERADNGYERNSETKL